jgi:hypothetical protein
MTWQSQAACRTTPNLFALPMAAIVDRHSARRSRPEVRSQIARAVAICHACPVYAECREWVLAPGDDPVPHHIAAGLVPWERQRRPRCSPQAESLTLVTA